MTSYSDVYKAKPPRSGGSKTINYYWWSCDNLVA